jgi:acetyl-CoA acetyltransferase
MSNQRRVAIVGVGQLPFRSRHPDRLFYELAYDAAQLALADANASVEQIDMMYHSIYCEPMMRQQIADNYVQDYLGLADKEGIRVAAGASTGGHTLRAAYAEILSGLSDVVLLSGVQKSTDVVDQVTGDRGDGMMLAQGLSCDMTWCFPFTALPPQMWAFLVQHHMTRWGTTQEQMAKVAVKAHDNALVNPNAQLRYPLTVDEVLQSRLIAWPHTMYMCCLYGESASALLLASEKRAYDFTDNPIWITGAGAVSGSTRLERPEVLEGRIPTIGAAADIAYRRAGLKDPSTEIDVVELHDITSGIELLTYEELRLCAPGESGRMIDEGIVLKDGRLPVNPSGGRIACGHIAGVSEVHSLAEVTLQLREEAAERQVAIRNGRGVVETMGSGIASQAAVVVLERGDR